FTPALMLAADSDVPAKVTPISGGEDLTPAILLSNIVNYILLFAAAIAVLFLIIGGIKYIVSQGNEKAVESSKHTILYAVIGLLIIILSFVIVRFVLNQAGGLTGGN
ncbi:hypothetical protein COY62_02755, partial [bacterium (Candidatus Howlettbacteria) CG_4_10_14_0_8_um_filter_40_9]